MKIFVAGHNGMVGSAILRELTKRGYKKLITRTRKQLDLLNYNKVNNFFKNNKIDFIFLAAAKVGGIWSNNYFKADFIYENLQVQNNIIHAAFKNKIKRICFFGSSCIYPRIYKKPIKEEDLLSSFLEKTNEPYAIAKIAGIKMCESFNFQYGTQYFSVMPCNLYGKNDSYNLKECHVLPALIKKIHLAKVKKQKEIIIWGSGKPRREFLYVDDLAKASVELMEKKIKSGVFNIGYGSDVSIKNLAILISKVINFKGGIKFDKSKPDGTFRKLLNSKKIINEINWHPKVSLEKGLNLTYEDFLKKEIFRNS